MLMDRPTDPVSAARVIQWWAWTGDVARAVDLVQEYMPIGLATE